MWMWLFFTCFISHLLFVLTNTLLPPACTMWVSSVELIQSISCQKMKSWIAIFNLWSCGRYQVVPSQQAKVQVKSWISGVKIKEEFQVLFDFVQCKVTRFKSKSCESSPHLWVIQLFLVLMSEIFHYFGIMTLHSLWSLQNTKHCTEQTCH